LDRIFLTVELIVFGIGSGWVFYSEQLEVSAKSGRSEVNTPEIESLLGGLLFYCPGGAEEFSPGFRPWETSNKAVLP
jgi:hypothetical protein